MNINVSRKTLLIFTLVNFLIVLTAVAVLFFKNKSSVAFVPQTQEVVPSSYDKGMTWDKAIKEDKLIAVNFYVDWCGYCKRFAPILDSLQKEYESQYNFVLINVDDPKNQKLAEEFNITGFPTLYLYNPKTKERIFVPQDIYSSYDLLKNEFDSFLKSNK